MANKESKTQLIIDVQLLQTSDRRRGMGLFLVGLLENLDPERLKGKGLIFVTNSRLPELHQDDVAILNRLGGQMCPIDLLHQGDNAEFMNSASSNRARLDEALSSIVSSAAADRVIYFIPALFSSEIHPVFPGHGTHNVLLFHDLIPFLYHERYFEDHSGIPRKDYAQRFREVYRTDLFVTNSQTTADDLMVYLGVDPSRIAPIMGSGAYRSRLTPLEPSYAAELAKGFVFMPSGDDLRKNNSRAVRAFAELESDLKLVVTSKFGANSQRELQAITPNVIFAGSISDAEFLWLLRNAKVVFFPPEYEGLGMPILEAVEQEAVVACSNIPVFAEISPKNFFYFDPYSVEGMAQALKDALHVDKQQYLKRASPDYGRILKAFSWGKTAETFLDALEGSKPAGPRRKLAIFCPSPSSYSAVGKYALEVHAELSRFFEIDYYAEEGVTQFHPTRPNLLECAANYYPASSFSLSKAADYDYILYNLGNSEFHQDTILNALRMSANAIVHDTHLNGIFDWLERNGFLPAERRQLEAELDQMFGAKDTSCLVSLLTNQQTVYCHSAFAKTALRAAAQTEPPQIVQTIHPIGVPQVQPLKLGDPTVSFAGIISEDKGIRLVAEIAKNPSLQVKIFGFGVLGDSPLLENLGSNVHILKDLTDKEFQDNLRQTDVLVNYRPNYHGETSRSVLEAMRYGVVVIVRDVGWYAELPDATVVKVKNESDIAGVVDELMANPARRQAIGEAARTFLAEQYDYARYAETLHRHLKGHRS